ncbi:MAG: efflux RND transporter periplasmic adaptor subunit [Puniceicoccales bacterium]|jgi:multidrug efflux system membrane fusion protein|nr:efflux RND transporter periplasmic adaptor subunit [Puniceicoccales bacterium]
MRKNFLRCIVAISVVFMSGCGEKGKQAQRPPIPVVSAKAILQDIREYADSVGICRACESVNVIPKVSGTLLAVHFKQGDTVRRGDLLYTIDPRTYKAALDQAVAHLAQAEAQLRLNEAKLERTKSLILQNFVSQQEYDACESSVQQGKAAVDAAGAAVEQARINLEYCSVVAPIDGVAGKYLIDVGNVLSQAALSSSTLVNIQNMDKLYVDFAISENVFPELYQAFNSSGGGLDVEVRLIANDEISAVARLEFIENAISKQSGSINLRAVLCNGDRKFWPGEAVAVKVFLKTSKDSVLVPYESVQLGQAGRYLFAIRDDKTVDLRVVSIGQCYGDLIVVKGGVSAGETVVKTGQLMLSPGAKVVEVPDQRKNTFKSDLKLDGDVAEKNPTTE